MKKFLLICLIALSVSAFGQSDNVGIGTTNPDNSAILDLSSSEKGFLLPRMTKDQRLNINNPAQGLQVFQTDGNSGLYIYSGTEWTNSANSVAAVNDPWVLGGNSISAGEFIGTTNQQPLLLKVKNQKGGFIDNDETTRLTFLGLYAGNANPTGDRNVGMGYRALFSTTTGVQNVAVGADALLYNTVGGSNVGVGNGALFSNVGGSNNVGIGGSSLRSNTSGNGNLAIGNGAMQFNTTGSLNTGIGSSALRFNQSGSNNIGIGFSALRVGTAGSDNIAIGNEAGYSNNGSGSVFLGKQAGYNETASNRLYIANSNTATPLIYGNFSAKFVSIGDVDPAKREAANTSGGYNLLVKGGILTEKVKVALASSADWADYVFEDNYKLMPLTEVEAFVKENKHLPNIPSAEEMVSNGLNVSETNKLMMEKIEELTLYVIQLQKEIEHLKKN